MKRSIAMILLACGCISMLALTVSARESGSVSDVYEINEYQYIIKDDGTAEIYAYTGGNENLTIADNLDGYTVTSIGEGAFYGCRVETVNIPDTIISIADNAFDSCIWLEEIYFPESISYIGNSPFRNCTDITKIDVSPDHPYLSVYEGVLFSKPDKRLICCPSELKKQSYTIPKGIIEIGDYAFYDCDELEDISIPNTVTSIGDYAFYYCSDLDSVVLPNTVTNIGDFAFFGCDDIDTINIPDALEYLGENPFDTELESVELSNNHNLLILENDILFFMSEKRLVHSFAWNAEHYNIPEGIESIDAYAFAGHEDLEYISFPNSLKNIGDYVFWSCYSLGSITIPESVTNIGEGAFDYCSNLEKIVLPSNISEIQEMTFSNCRNLQTIFLPEGITKIGDSAFKWCEMLNNISLPPNITTIGEDAFYACESLETLELPETVEFIGEYAFTGCDALVLTVTKDSYAALYCQINSLDFTYPGSMDWLNE